MPTRLEGCHLAQLFLSPISLSRITAEFLPSCPPPFLLHSSSHCCPYVLTAHKAKQHMKADCAIVALNQASFASNCFLRRGRNKMRRQKERGGGRGWNDATPHSSLPEMEMSEHRVKAEMCNIGSCSYFSRVSVKASEVRDVNVTPPPKHTEKLCPISVTWSRNRYMSQHRKLNFSVCIYCSRAHCTHAEPSTHSQATTTPWFQTLPKTTPQLTNSNSCRSCYSSSAALQSAA